MTRVGVRALVDRLKIPIVVSNGEGIQIRRATASGIPPVWREEIWRLRCGSGIASRSRRWNLVPLNTSIGATSSALGPFTNQRALAKALRAWRKWDL